MTVNIASITLDVEYSLNGIAQTPINGWPAILGGGSSNGLCTSASTPLGTYTFTGIRNTLNAGMPYATVNAQVTVIN